MKVLHVIDSGGLYGAEVMLLNLMSEQASMGLEPILASISDPYVAEKPLEVEARRRGLRVETFRMKSGPNFIGAFKLLKYAWGEKIDILHSHGYKGNILFGLMPRMLRRLPMVATIHGWTWTGGVSRMMVYEWLDSQSLSHIDRVIAVSSGMKEHPRIRNRSDLALEVVANGIQVESESLQKDSSGLSDEITAFCGQSFTIGAIGRLSPEKGFEALLDAVASLSAQGADIRLVILGEGGQRNSLGSTARKLGIESKLLMPGYVKDARRYLPLFSLFAMPSLTEGLPMVLLEAMQAAVPIVASRVGGIPEVLQDGRCGLLIEPGDQKALELGIGAVMINPKEAAQRAGAARQRVMEAYSSLAMAEKYQAIYRSVLSE